MRIKINQVHSMLLLSVTQRTNLAMTPTGQPAEYYVENCIAFGDLYQVAGSRIKLVGWNDGVEKIATVRAIRSRADLSLRGAKHVLDGCLADRLEVVECNSAIDSEQLILELEELGFRAEQLSA